MSGVWDAFGPLSHDFCEEYLPGVIRAPANSWSNLAYIIAGVIIIILYARHRTRGTSWVLAPVSFLIGITSFLFHASGTRFFQLIDISAMFLFTSYLLAANLVRLTGKRGVFGPVYGASMAVLVGGLYLLGTDLGGFFFDGELLVVFAIEFWLSRTPKRAPLYRFFFLALGFFLLSWIPWFLDYYHVWCDPTNHVLQAHALWHVLTAFSLVFAFIFYQRIEEKSGRTEKQ